MKGKVRATWYDEDIVKTNVIHFVSNVTWPQIDDSCVVVVIDGNSLLYTTLIKESYSEF